MNRNHELKIAGWLLAVFAAAYFSPVGQARFDGAVTEALALTQWYAREHVVLCLLPAFWIAGGIAAFVSQSSVMRYLGPRAPKPVAYGVGAVSGTILAVCSCTVLPLFAGIYRMGAGLGPATAFLYSGPAINALAIILTANVLGARIGLARGLAAIGFSVVIGLLMAFFFRREEQDKAAKAAELPEPEPARPLWQTATLFAAMLGILVFSNWGGAESSGFFAAVHAFKWWLSSAFALAFAMMLWSWLKVPGKRLLITVLAVIATSIATGGNATWAVFTGVLGLAWMTAGREGEAGEWFEQTWTYTKQIMPLLLGGVLVAGLLLGRPDHEGLIPASWISEAVGGNSFGSNLFAALAGAFMYFATLTEIPILQGLMGNGMGSGPALALLLAGPALSLPNMLVINTVIGPRKTATYVFLVVVMATLTGWGYGAFFPAT
ncbi:permease [Haloferula rosea]|uniref:Permease n=1 Tax=Haloferula rosea TaxID=490093 RepID=A0A934RE95_9BACT|nr:permease [Haloferula rosea]MBK1828925.1 permease [Haloferula rosea]